MIKYEVRFTKQFKKDLKLAKKQGKDTEKLFEVIEKLASDEVLDVQYKDHDLTGNYKGCRECHVEPDWLLVYVAMRMAREHNGRCAAHASLSRKNGAAKIRKAQYHSDIRRQCPRAPFKSYYK